MTDGSSISTNRDKPAIPIVWVKKLFDEMTMLFGNLFAQQWENVDPEKMQIFWSEKMYGLTNDEIRRGVNAMRKLAWPPTLPQFLELCRPSIDETVAYYEAVHGMERRRAGEMGEWSHPAIFWAAAKMTHDLLNQPYSSIRSRWEKELSLQLEKNIWPEIPAVCKALSAPGRTETSREKAKRELEKLNASEILKKQPGLAWSRKILERGKQGEELPAISIRLANEALSENAS